METSVTQEILDNVRIEMFQPGHQLRTLLIFNKYESIGVALYALKKSRDFPKQPTIPEFVSSPPSYCSRANIQLPCTNLDSNIVRIWPVALPHTGHGWMMLARENPRFCHFQPRGFSNLKRCILAGKESI